jgi:Na+/H+ antiporter NhaD/arsenite permease-like protein
MTVAVVAVFAVVYLGMILGGLPFLQLDRTGVALLGAIAIVAVGDLTPQQAAEAIHLPTLLLFSFMVISAQMRLGGSTHGSPATSPRCRSAPRRCWRR